MASSPATPTVGLLAEMPVVERAARELNSLLEEITQEQEEEAVAEDEERAEELAAACRVLGPQVACGESLVLFLVLLPEHTTKVAAASLHSRRRAWRAQLRPPQLVFAGAKGCCGSNVALGLEERRQFAVVWPAGEAALRRRLSPRRPSPGPQSKGKSGRIGSGGHGGAVGVDPIAGYLAGGEKSG